jgi:alkylation response protein AidB-like acyl-CoA dehydrogenase
MQQIFKTAWNAAEDPRQQAANFAEVMQAINSVDWAALTDFDDIAREARRLRLTALATPTRLGGRGLSNHQVCAAFRALEKADTASAHIIGYHTSLGAFSLLLSGKFELGGYLKGIATGDGMGILAVTEAQGGSHMAGMKTTARRIGDQWEVNGTKMYIAHAQAGTFINICVPTEQGFKIFVVDRKNPGLSVSRSFRMAYMKRIILNEVQLNAARVPEEYVIHDPKVLYDVMMVARMHILAGKVGHIERCLERLTPFISDRLISTGRMIDNPHIQRQVRHLELSRTLLETLLNHMLEEEERDGAAYELAITAKITGVGLAMEASHILRSLHGARGLDPQTGIPQIADDVRVWTVMEGCNEPLGHFLAVNYLKHKPWLAALRAKHRDSFAGFPAPESIAGQPDADLVSLGYALSWAILRACTHERGVATPETDRFLDRRIANCLYDVETPLAASAGVAL